jgi:hypothetical protein
MKIRLVTCVVLALVLLLAVAVEADRAKHSTEVIPSGGAKNAVVDIQFAAGTLVVNPKDMADIAELDLFYDPEFVDVIIERDVRDQTLFVSAESDFDDHRHDMKDIDNDWDVNFSTRTPMELHMEMGACKADVDLGGVPIRELSIDIGAASGVLDFSSPNPERMKEFEIEAGASSLDLINVGNANFEFFKFSGGAGSFDLDLRGKYTGESEIEIEVGLGKADITLPKGLPVRIESDKDQWFSSVDLHGGNLDEVEDGIYESPDFEKASTRLTIRLDIGMGSVDVRWRS